MFLLFFCYVIFYESFFYSYIKKLVNPRPHKMTEDDCKFTSKAGKTCDFRWKSCYFRVYCWREKNLFFTCLFTVYIWKSDTKNNKKRLQIYKKNEKTSFYRKSCFSSWIGVIISGLSLIRLNYLTGKWSNTK